MRVLQLAVSLLSACPHGLHPAMQANAAHGADSAVSASREIKFLFGDAWIPTPGEK